uniref:Glycosyltransferase n=1 Tax=Rhizophora mucronata TaxID=61149 RepID=A0A2P2LXT3_RHIMU
MATTEACNKPHAVLIPAPLQSHIKQMLKLGKLLCHKGFHITFVNTEFNHKRFLKSMGPNSLRGYLAFRFETIPDGLPPSDPDATQGIPAIAESVSKNFLAPFRQLLAKLNDTASSNVPPVTCIVADGFLSFTITAAEELGVPLLFFFTISACALMGIKQFNALKDKGLTPLRDESYLTNGYLENIVEWIPGMKGIRLRDLPSFVGTTGTEDFIFNFMMESAEKAVKAPAILIHTFDALDKDVLNGLSSVYSRVYAVGPLQLLLNQIQETAEMKSIGYNLWKEESDCLEWLDSKEPNSVVYMNFGSITVLTHQQLVEFGMGLAYSEQPFLWIIRPDLVRGESAGLPPEFAEQTRGRGLIRSWCPQDKVLNHPSTGGFLTHSGWGSTIESLSAGVPMLCWPFVMDQKTNCRYTCTEWGIGMEINNNVKRDEVEKLVEELMAGVKGKVLREKATEWKKLAEEATASPNGSSCINLDKLVSEVLLPKRINGP